MSDLIYAQINGVIDCSNQRIINLFYETLKNIIKNTIKDIYKLNENKYNVLHECFDFTNVSQQHINLHLNKLSKEEKTDICNKIKILLYSENREFSDNKNINKIYLMRYLLAIFHYICMNQDRSLLDKILKYDEFIGVIMVEYKNQSKQCDFYHTIIQIFEKSIDQHKILNHFDKYILEYNIKIMRYDQLHTYDNELCTKIKNNYFDYYYDNFNEKLKIDFEELQNDFNYLDNENQKLEIDDEKLRNDNKEFKKDIKELKNDIERLKNENRHFENENKDLKNNNEQLEQKNKKLQEDYDNKSIWTIIKNNQYIKIIFDFILCIFQKIIYPR